MTEKDSLEQERAALEARQEEIHTQILALMDRVHALERERDRLFVRESAITNTLDEMAQGSVA